MLLRDNGMPRVQIVTDPKAIRQDADVPVPAQGL